MRKKTYRNKKMLTITKHYNRKHHQRKTITENTKNKWIKNQLNIYLEFVNKIKDAFEEKLPSIFCEFDTRITEIENKFGPRKNF